MPATLTDSKKSATRIPFVLRQHERLPTPCTKLVRISGAAQWRFPAAGAQFPFQPPPAQRLATPHTHLASTQEQSPGAVESAISSPPPARSDDRGGRGWGVCASRPAA